MKQISPAMILLRSLLPLLILTPIRLIPGSGAGAQVLANAFEKDILAFEAIDRTNAPSPGSILLVGDSQFTRWKTVHQDLQEYRIVNRGFGGSKMTDLLRYTDRIVLRYKPRMIVVNEGGNDIHSGRTPGQLLADIQTFISRVREALPDVPIAFSGLTPSPARWSEAATRLHFNQMLKGYLATGTNLVYLDLFDSYLGADGKPRDELFVEDKLHHSAAGYAVRVRIMRPILGAPDFQERQPAR
ncbi:MAG: GDSL-type esterase/lipase family protein [Verrucomicrobiota bacterium]